MVNQELIDWIKTHGTGRSRKEIHEHLVDHGYNSKDVDEAFDVLGAEKSTTPKRPKSSFTPILIISAIVLLTIIVGLVFYFSLSTESQSMQPTQSTEIIHRSVTSTEELVTDEGGSLGKLTVKIEADLEVTTDCAEGLVCFEERFAKCEPSTVTIRLMESLAYYYEIIGPKAGLCEVKSKFLANPNPAYLDKWMVCQYDNSKNFETATEEGIHTCKGPLYEQMFSYV